MFDFILSMIKDLIDDIFVLLHPDIDLELDDEWHEL